MAELILSLGVGVLISSIGLCVMSLWYWWTALKDYRAVCGDATARLAVIRASRGEMVEGYFKLACSFMWLLVGIGVVTAPVTASSRWQVRAFILTLIWIYIVKIAVERLTRYGVDSAINAELTAAQIAHQLAAKVEEQHKEILEAISDNTRLTKETGEAAGKAFDEANHANEKIINLNERLIESEKRKQDR